MSRRADLAASLQPIAGEVDRLRVPPQSVESEQNVLGGLLLANAAVDKIRALLVESDFYRRDHRLIFRGILELADKGQPFDAVTLGEWFEANLLAEQVGGASYIIDLASNTASAANIVAYAQIVRDKSHKRQAIDAGTALVNSGFDPALSAVEALSGAQTSLQALTDASTASDAGPVNLPALWDAPLVLQRFAVTPYLPVGVVTLLGSHGGAGKTTLALTIAAHFAAGRYCFGCAVEPGLVVFASLEDEGGAVAYKLRCINTQYGLNPAHVAENIRLLDWSHGDTALAVERSEAGVRTVERTALFARLRAAVRGAALIIIDNASDAFDGDENNRRQVGTFMRWLRNIAREESAAVLLLAHIDKAAARVGASGNSYSGSTAWHNAARSRLALVNVGDGGEVELRQEKLNRGKAADPLRLRWAEHGVLVPSAGGDGDQDDNGADDDAGVLAALRAAALVGVDVSAGRTGPATAQQVLATFPSLPVRLRGPKGRGPFWAAVSRLQQFGRIEVIYKNGANRHPRAFLVEAKSALFNPPHPLPVELAQLARAIPPALDARIPNN